MELNKLNISSIFGEKMNQIDFISGLVTDKNTSIAPSNTENGIQTETINLSGEIEDIKTPSSPGNIGNNAITKNTTNNSGETRNYSSSYGPQQQTTNISNVQQNTNGNITNGVNSNGGLNLNSTNGATTTESGDNKSLGASKGTSKTKQSQVVKITEEKEENEKTASAGGTSGSSGRGNTSVESEGKTSGEDKITKIGNKTTEKEEETKEENTKMESKTSGQKIKEDLSKRTQYEYDVEENARKDEVDSAMQNMGVQEGEYEKYIKILETTINSEEQHIQFTKDNDKRLAELYGKKDSATGEYTNAKELLDIINSDDPKKEIKYLPLTGEDGEKATKEIWEEKYEEAKEKYKDNEIFQKDTYESLSAEEKIKFVKELTKEEIKEAYKEEREQVYEDYQEIDIEGNVGGLGLYKKEDFDDLTEKEKIEFIGRYNNKKYTQLTFSVDDMKEWNEDIDEKALEGMSDSIVDRETSVKQLKYLKKEAEMQKDIYQYEKVVYTEDYKNYTEKGTEGYEDKKKYLNSEQNKILDYIYNEQGKEKADEYIKALRGQIAKGQGIEQANEFLTELESDPEKMNKFMEVMKDADKFNKCLKEGFIDGVGTFGEGIKNFFTDDYELSALEWKEQAILEVLSNNTEYSNGWCDKAYQYGNVVGNLAPSMLTTAAVTAATGGAAAPEALSFAFTTTGELAGTLAMTISAAGSSKHQALMNGADTTEAWAYGICSGLSESTMERFLGSIPGLSKLEGGYFKKMISEGLEEGSQEFVTAALNSVILDEDVNIDDVISQAKESFTMGASVSALLNISALKKTKIKLKYKGETVEISENARAKIEEEITKVNEGSIDAETGNKNALEILEKELNKKGKVKEEIKADDIENIEIKGSKEKVDSTKSKEKIEIEGDKEKASKELSSIEDKIRIASEDIKKINKQEKQEKKESKELEKQLKKQKEVKLTESVNKEQNTILKNIDVTENVENVLKGDISIVKSAIGTVMSVPGFFGRFIYKDISQNKTLIDHTVENGLYHLTTADGAQKIIESGYVKASSATTSYGSKKAFFFSGVPSVQNVALNMDNIPSKITAVKINTDVEQLVTPNFKYRPDDAAIVHKGNYEIKNDAEIKYLCLVNKGGKLQYQEVPKNVYDSYNVNIKASKLKALAIAYQNYSDFFFNKHNSDIVRNINVDIDSKLDNNIINFDTKKRSIKDLNVDKLKEVQKSSKNYLYDSNIEIDPSTIEMENIEINGSKELESKIKLDKTKDRIDDISAIEQINSQQNTIGQYQSYTEISNLFNFGYQKDYKNVKLIAKDKTNLAKLKSIYRKNLKRIYTDSSNLQIILTDANIIPNLNKGIDYSNVSQHGSLIVMSLSEQGINSGITINHEIQHLYGKVLKRINIQNLAANITKYGLNGFLNQAHSSGLSEDLMINWINQRKSSVETIVRNQLLHNIKLENLTSNEILQLESQINTKVSKILKTEGVLSFADMWDAITGGKVYENTGIGHGKGYYEKSTVMIADELLAQYATLKKHQLLENFKSALPSDLLKVLDVAYNDTNTQLEIEKLLEKGNKRSLFKAIKIANSFESNELKNNFINYIEGIAKEKGYIKGEEINIKSPQGNNNIQSIQNIIDTNIKDGNFTEIANLLNQIKDNSEYNKVESYVKNYLVNLENYGALANIYKVLGDYTQAYRFGKLKELDNFIKNVNNIPGSKYSAYVTDGVRADLKTTVWNQLINYYKGKEGITIKPWSNGAFLNFNIGTNIDTKTEPLLNSYKIYLPLDKSTAYTSVTQIMDYLVKNNIKSDNKISKVTRADALVLRIDNQNDAVNVINFINNNALIPSRENTGISAAFKFNKVQLAMDGRTSYNSIATELISDYAKKNPGGSINGFRKYVNNLINEIKLGNLDNLKQTLGDSIVNIRADDYNAKVVNVIQIIQMLQLSLNPDSDISDYLNLGKKFQSKDVFNNMYASVEQALGNYAAFAENSNFDVTNHIKNRAVLAQYIKEQNNKVSIPSYAENILYNYIIGINSSDQIAFPYRKIISQMDIREIAQFLSLDADKVVSDKESYSSAIMKLGNGRDLMKTQIYKKMGLSCYKEALSIANQTKNNLIIKEIQAKINNQAFKYFNFKNFDDAYELYKLTKNEQELLNVGKGFVDNILQSGNMNQAKQFSLKSGSVDLKEYTTSKLNNKIYESITKGNINKAIEIMKINYECKSIADIMNAERDIVKKLVEKFINYLNPTDNLLDLKINNKIPEGIRAMMIKYVFDCKSYLYPNSVNETNVVNDLESAVILSLLDQNLDITPNNIQKILNELNNNNTKSITKKLGALKYVESYLKKNSKAKKYLDLKTLQDIQSNYGVIPTKTFEKIENFFNECIAGKIKVNQNENFVTAFAKTSGSEYILNSLLKYANSDVGQSFLSRLTVGEAIAVYNYTVGSGVFQRFVGTGKYDKYSLNSNINSYYEAKMNVDYLDSALEKGKGLTQNQIFYRGDDFGKILKFCGFKNYESLKNSIGKTFVCKSYLSSGVSEDGAFSGNIKWKIKCDAGKKYGAYINEISHYSKSDMEYEFLFRRNSKIRIDGVKKAYDGTIYLDVTILGIEGY